ncbi:MAG: hypothetical protein ACTJG1_12345 [Enterococcus gilvus]
MGNEKTVFRNSVLEKINFKRIEELEMIRVESKFSFKVNKQDLKQIMARCEYCLFNNEETDSFLEVAFSGFFENEENEKTDIDFESDENALVLVNQLLPDINSTISDIMEKSYGSGLELPNTINPNDIDSNNKDLGES